MGKNIVAKSTNSDGYDLFGHTMNICAKINSKAPPNGMVIGNALYQVLKSFSSPHFSMTIILKWQVNIQD